MGGRPPAVHSGIWLAAAIPEAGAFFRPLSTPGPRVLHLAAVTWLGGGNILVAYHYKRVGKSPWAGFKPFAFPFRHFNAREWLILAGLAALAFTFCGFAMSLNPR